VQFANCTTTKIEENEWRKNEEKFAIVQRRATATFFAISSYISQVSRQALRHQEARRSLETLDLTGDLARTRKMRYLKYLVLLAICMLPAAVPSQAQVRFAVGVGGGYGYAPVCAYGYYGYSPYACAPYGYYGPDWFVGGVFIGAGPWFHGYRGRAFYSRPGFYGRGFYGRPGFVGRGGFVRGGRGFAGGGFRGSPGGFHGGGFRGGGHR